MKEVIGSPEVDMFCKCGEGKLILSCLIILVFLLLLIVPFLFMPSLCFSCLSIKLKALSLCLSFVAALLRIYLLSAL